MRIKKQNIIGFFTKQDMALLKQKIKNLRDQCVIFTGIECGARVGEMRSITPESIDWRNRVLTKVDSKKHVERKCGISPWLAQQLQFYIAAFRIEKRQPLFDLSEKQMDYILKKWAREAGIFTDTNWLSWHIVRRTYINQCAQAGIDSLEVEAVTGDRLDTIMRYYRKANPGDTSAKMAKFYQED